MPLAYIHSIQLSQFQFDRWRRTFTQLHRICIQWDRSFTGIMTLFISIMDVFAIIMCALSVTMWYMFCIRSLLSCGCLLISFIPWNDLSFHCYHTCFYCQGRFIRWCRAHIHWYCIRSLTPCNHSLLLYLISLLSFVRRHHASILYCHACIRCWQVLVQWYYYFTVIGL